MKNTLINALAKQLLSSSTPSDVVEGLLQKIDNLETQLDNAGPVIHKTRCETVHSGTAIKLASLQMHQLFHLLKVPNAIHSKVRFPDGLYEITFTRLKTPNFN